jgi:branched-chain amino acid transport system substrate-binding protein
MKFTRAVLLVFILTATLSVSGAALAQDDCGFAEEPIIIGGVAPLSAPGAVTAGVAMQWSMEQAVADINADCGIAIDGQNYELAITIGDSEGLPDAGQRAAERLIEVNGIVGAVGVYHSAVGLATMDVFQDNQIPTVYSEPWNDNVTIEGLTRFEEDGIDYIFRIAPTSTVVSRAAVDWLLNEGVEDVVIIAENTDYGIGAVEQNEAFFADAGVEVETIFIELGTEDFVPILSRIQAGDPPDAIRIEVTGETGFNVTQQMIELGIAPTDETICNTMQDAIQPEYWENVPDGNFCAFYKVGIAPANYNEQTEAYVAAYREEFDSEPAGYAMASYDSVGVLADAIERAGTLEDPEAIVTALEETDVTLTQGRYYFEYTSTNPLPEDGSVPQYLWHQWPDPAVIVIQYTEEGQDSGAAPVVWPPAYQTEAGTSYFPPN